MNRGIVIIVVALLAGGVGYHFLKPSAVAVSRGGTDSHDLNIEHRKMDPALVRVAQGTNTTFIINTDEASELHVEGYEVMQSIAPGRAAELRFTADKAGTYLMHVHPASDPDAEISVGTLEVRSQ
ncbi:hypothetical protein A2765_03715 [Candidatus Kaiserbacteria bacterium RIFCSPHIGHO2_01_FULL_56_24]|uniref:EfeO-type cupredoxin-like domain-containing protein n=1 Tax=Candidatus Kaiserbacteria bacterium RIFCSPHIGHO2_01_FULL_56_24 TaxID=1798487 RepID=A0A1F6DH03_9BACT|nr:MAG: hypothetical protein A2765_03715 [Candidatus Kaiserbacteria bacterium RIFCSPHIGHO2_01_FULL_56_24]